MPNFRFWIPATIIEKAIDEKTGKRVMRIGGMASTTRKDTDGENLDPTPQGFDIEYLKEKGIVNWNHSKLPEAIIGEPTKVQFKDKGLWVESELYEDSELANKVYDLAVMLKKNSKTRRLGYSIEGKVIERDPDNEKKVKKAMITNIALTISPKNPDSIVDIIKGDFHDFSDDELKKSSETDPLDDVVNGGKITYIVDITREDGNRITIDNDYNIKVEKCMDTVEGAAIIPSHVDGQKLKGEKQFLTKSEVFEKIFQTNSVIMFETANEIFEKLNNLTMSTSNSKTQITDDLLSKALGSLGLKKNKSSDEIKKGGDTEEDEIDESETSPKKKDKHMKKASVPEEDDEDEEDDDEDEEDEKKEDKEKEKKSKKKEEIKKSTIVAASAPNNDQNEMTELIKSLAIIAKGTYDLQKTNQETLSEIKDELKKSNDSLEELGNGMGQSAKSITKNSKAVERNFEKGIDDDLSPNQKTSAANTLSISQNKSKIVSLLDALTFEKGFDDELGKALTTFESSGQLSGKTINTLRDKGYNIIN